MDLSNSSFINDSTVLDPNIGENAEQANSSAILAEIQLKRNVYGILVPVLVCFLLVSGLFSSTVLMSIPFIKRPISPIVRLSLSLATANVAFCLAVTSSILIHSYLPFVHGVRVHNCINLTLEVVRSGIIAVQVYHLLAVALIHYYGTVKPLHISSRLTPSRMKALVGALWIIPRSYQDEYSFVVKDASMTRDNYFYIETRVTSVYSYVRICYAQKSLKFKARRSIPALCLLVGFSLIPNQGYQSPHCNNNYFFLYGLTFRVVWCSVIMAPTLILVMVYWRIFKLLKNRAQTMVTPEQRTQLQRSLKTVITSALIVGTFIIGWFPAALTYLLVCKECLIKSLEPKYIQLALFTSNYMIFILKVFADTFIYVVGLRDIRVAMSRLWHLTALRCCSLVGSNRAAETANAKFLSCRNSTSKTSPSKGQSTDKITRKETNVDVTE